MLEAERWNRNPIQWFFLVGDRLVVSGVICVGMVAYFVGLYLLDLIQVQGDMAMYYLLGALVSGNLALTTLVISINQLVVSRQLGSPGELREQIRNVNEYRQDVIESADMDTAPVTPSDFLEALLQSTRQEVQRFGGMVAGTDDEELREDVDEFVEAMTAHIDDVVGLLETRGVSTFNVLSATLTTNYAQHIHEARLIRVTYGAELSEEETDAIDDVVTRLQQIDVARQYFKTLYTQSELAYLSRILLYVGTLSLLVLATLLVLFTSSSGGPSVPASVPDVTVAVILGVGFAPLAVLGSFVLRLAVVTQRTAAITPFTTPEQET